MKLFIHMDGTLFRQYLPHSEVCMSMQVAGQKRLVSVVGRGQGRDPVIQIYNEDKSEFSFPILMGEAGFYRDENGKWYTTGPVMKLDTLAGIASAFRLLPFAAIEPDRVMELTLLIRKGELAEPITELGMDIRYLCENRDYLNGEVEQAVYNALRRMCGK